MNGGFKTLRPGLDLTNEEQTLILERRAEQERQRQAEFAASIADEFTVSDGGPVEVTLFKHGGVILADPDNHWESISLSAEAFQHIVVRWFEVKRTHRGGE